MDKDSHLTPQEIRELVYYYLEEAAKKIRDNYLKTRKEQGGWQTPQPINYLTEMNIYNAGYREGLTLALEGDLALAPDEVRLAFYEAYKESVNRRLENREGQLKRQMGKSGLGQSPALAMIFAGAPTDAAGLKAVWRKAELKAKLSRAVQENRIDAIRAGVPASGAGGSNLHATSPSATERKSPAKPKKKVGRPRGKGRTPPPKEEIAAYQGWKSCKASGQCRTIAAHAEHIGMSFKKLGSLCERVRVYLYRERRENSNSPYKNDGD